MFEEQDKSSYIEQQPQSAKSGKSQACGEKIDCWEKFSWI